MTFMIVFREPELPFSKFNFEKQKYFLLIVFHNNNTSQA